MTEKSEEWLIMFKNETHNHPTEIEPWRRRHLLGGSDKGSAVGKELCISSHENNGKRRPQRKDIGHLERQARKG